MIQVMEENPNTILKTHEHEPKNDYKPFFIK